MTNIKNIGKELLGKSLNSFHKKTGLTQLEKNNEMQDGILNGILSQVDDAYIEKTEQSNVMHLDGSGDGVVVLDSIEGNTMVNLIGDTFGDSGYYTKNNDGSINIIKHDTTLPPFKNENHRNLNLLKPNTKYTLIVNGDYTKVHAILRDYKIEGDTSKEVIEILNSSLSSNKTVFTTYHNKTYIKLISSQGDSASNYPINNLFVSILEGDWTDKELPPYFEGLQSSFEEKVNNEGKYEIEILSKNNNLIEESIVFKYANYASAVENVTHYSKVYSQNENNITKTRILGEPIPLIQNKTMYFKCDGFMLARAYFNKDLIFLRDDAWKSNTTKLEPPKDAKYIALYLKKPDDSIITDSDIKFVKENAILGCFEKYEDIKKIAPKQNKIKLLINEPLRAIGDIKDRLCVKDDKLVVERNFKEIILDGSRNWGKSSTICNSVYYYYSNFNVEDAKGTQLCLCNNIKSVHTGNVDEENIFIWHTKKINIGISKNKLSTDSVDSFKQLLQSNPIKMVYQLAEPIYEEVLNEYGEPIILEGYENGTLYIDSIITPTISVRYTPKMESFKTVKEVNNNNVMLTNDINDAIIPYMLEVDMMILEKEMAIMSHKNIRKIGEKDMTSMQKRTYDMLARLIKGKTLNEQECKTRVTVYLNAGKITDEQAKELNFLIDEIYA